MRRPIEEPVTTQRPGPGALDESVTTHPSFASIGVSRVSGHQNLYDSDFSHNHYMTVRIGMSELHRSLNRDWHMGGRREYIEVALSESQWATFVSSPNVGSGTPCTLTSLNGEMIAGLPDPAPRSEQFGDEIKQDLAEAVEAIASIDKLVEELGIPKGKAAQIKEAARVARSRLEGSIPWVIKSADEHMEQTVERAKSEVHGYMVGALQRAGIEAIAGRTLPLAIEAPKEN